VYVSLSAAIYCQVQAGDTCYMFDVLKAGANVMSQLKAMLEDVSVVKVIHDSRNDSVSLFYQKGIKIQNIFDTQVWCNLTKCMTPSRHGMLCVTAKSELLHWQHATAECLRHHGLKRPCWSSKCSNCPYC